MSNKIKYADFYAKWANKQTYDEGLNHSLAGILSVFRRPYQLPHMKGYNIIADIWSIPTIHGWGYDEKKRRLFYKEAKAAGLNRLKDRKNEWYKIIEINE